MDADHIRMVCLGEESHSLHRSIYFSSCYTGSYEVRA